MTRVVASIEEWRKERKSKNFLNKTVGFVPTMGALHAGHESLLKRCREENEIAVLSIFVNPRQFNDPNDLQNYPRNFSADLKIAEKYQIDYVFHPNEKEMYADNYHYQISEQTFSQLLCGQSRPGHFTGVLTIVMKLLQLIQPHRAYFGEKDYQQYLLIKGMAEAFFLKTTIVPCSTIRDRDGLALSSRNQLLSAEERQLAAQFAHTLDKADSSAEAIMKLKKLGISIDYVEERLGRRLAAVRIGNIRLIDNIALSSK